MSNKQKTILLTNDDGVRAEGLRVLRDALSALGDVLVVAPETEQSASSHAITLHEPLRIREIRKHGKVWGFAVKGKPVDCVKVATRAILTTPPDLVVSGINPGPNLGISVIYSGTVAAALEGAASGIPAMAVSLDEMHNPDFTAAAEYAVKIADWLLKNGCPDGTALNVNVPFIRKNQIKGIRVTRQGKARFKELLDKRIDPRKTAYYWLGGGMVEMEEEESVDYIAHRHNYVSVTPLRADLTDYNNIDKFADLD